MSSYSSFVATSSLAGLTAIRTAAGGSLLNDAPGLLARLRERAPALAALFASPLLAPPTPGQQPLNASWYGIHDHAARPLAAAQPALRDQALQDLRGLLTQALALRDDPDLGGLLPALLTLPSADSIMTVGGHPVFINWGFGPAGLDTSAEGLRAHFDTLFGPLCGVTWPVEEEPATPTAVGAGAGAAAIAAPEQVPQDAPAEPPPAPSPTPSPALASAPLPLAAASAPRWHPWAVPLAVALGLLILALLWWIVWAPGGLLNRAPTLALDTHGPVLDGLRRERDRLQGLQGMACGPALTDALREGYSRPLAPRAAPMAQAPADAPPGTPAPAPAEPLPPPPDLSDLPAAPAARMTALARALEYSAALVLGESAQGTALGTAFFITPDTLVTNRHVVEDLRPTDPLMVTSQALGRLLPARVVARTHASDIGGPDFAVLRLEAPAAGAVPLAVAPTVDKLSRVVTAGYPGYIAQSDTAFSELLAGRSAAAPSMVFTSGEVSVVQRQDTGSTIVIHTADMSQGNSGGPLVDLCGRVVGVNTFIGMDEASGRRGLYALGGTDLLAFLAANGISADRADGPCGAEADGAPASGT